MVVRLTVAATAPHYPLPPEKDPSGIDQIFIYCGDHRFDTGLGVEFTKDVADMIFNGVIRDHQF